MEGLWFSEGLSMYAFFQPRISVAQEEADIKSMIDREYERKEQEKLRAQYIYEKSLFEQYDSRSIITFEEWLEIKNIQL